MSLSFNKLSFYFFLFYFSHFSNFVGPTKFPHHPFTAMRRHTLHHIMQAPHCANTLTTLKWHVSPGRHFSTTPPAWVPATSRRTACHLGTPTTTSRESSPLPCHATTVPQHISPTCPAAPCLASPHHGLPPWGTLHHHGVQVSTCCYCLTVQQGLPHL